LFQQLEFFITKGDFVQSQFKKNSMKNFKLVTIFFFLCLASCKKDDATTPSGSGLSLGTLICKIDGKEFTTNLGFSTKTTSSGTTILQVSGVSSNGSQSVILSISKFTGAKKYDVDGLTVATSLLVNSLDLYYGFSDTNNISTVTITKETSTNVEGTFSFSAKKITSSSTISKVTEGKFNAKIQ
jgi:hypothetical protein